MLKGHTIVSLAGAQGSGKSTLGTYLARYLKTLHVETSAVVQDTLSFDLSRDDLHTTGSFTKDDKDWLGRAIEQKIIKWLPKYKKSTVVLSGVREREVHSYLRRQGARLHIFEVAADPNLRFYRLKDLGKVSDARHFLDKELNERILGLPKVIAQAKYTVETKQDIPAELQAKAIAKALFEKGIKCN